MAKKYSASGENRGLSVDSKSPLSDTENLALRILLSLLRAGLQTGSGTEQLPGVIEEAQWNEVYRMASRHGILGIIWDGIRNLSAESLIPRTLKLGWAYNTEIIGQRYDRQKKTAIEMAGLLAREGISVLVFKGLSMSMYYPVPEHRECGDIDIWLFGQAEKGNRVAKAAGAKVEKENSKHDIIYFHGVPFENHKELTSELLNSRNRLINKDLITRVKDDRTQPLFATDTLRTPSRVFDELYIPVHAAGHFVVEGISLRHLCDWALIVQANGGFIDMALFDKLRLGQFVRLLNTLCHEWFGIEIPLESRHRNRQLAARIGADILNYGSSPTTDSRWKLLQLKFRRFFTRKWCYPIVGGNFYLATIRSSIAHLKSPHDLFKGDH